MPGRLGKRVATPPGGKETIGVEIGFGPKDLDKLNMNGGSNVTTVSGSKHNSKHP